MVTTLKNAFATDRIAQGYMLTGVRGVGKTTTARILARALNYEREGVDKPTFDMPEFGRHCAEIMEGRHPDVLEMDAASNTGVDNMREIIESARYKPLLARYKVYLIDEVHMLSKGAFNALLKTLEEPPEHVKFIFATTEVRKVPVTVLSRCQRFDLRRVDVPVLMQHFAGIVAKEGGTGRGRCGLALIARAAAGLGARWPVAARPGAGDGLRPRRRGPGARHAGPRRPRPHLRSARAAAGRHGPRGAEACSPGCTATAPSRCRCWPTSPRPCTWPTRAKSLGAEAAGEGLSAEEKRRAAALGGRLSHGDPVARLADAAQGPGGGRRRAQRHGRGRDGADPPRLHGGPAAARRDHQGAGRRRPARPAAAPRASQPASAPERRAPAGVAARLLPTRIDERRGRRGHRRDEDAAPGLGGCRRCRSCARSPRWWRWPARAARPSSRCTWKSTSASSSSSPPAASSCICCPAPPRSSRNELREKLNAWTGKRWMVALSKAPGERTLGEVAREREAAELREIQKPSGRRGRAAAVPRRPDHQRAALAGMTSDDTGRVRW